MSWRPIKPPVKGWPDIYVTSLYGERIHPVTGEHHLHNGIDIPLEMHTVIQAPFGGIMVANETETAGIIAGVRDPSGRVQVLFFHCAGLLVEPGQRVQMGQDIAASGNTGRSTGPHTHMMVTIDSRPVDPIPYLGNVNVYTRST